MSSLPSLQCCRGPQKSNRPFQTGICPKPLLPWLKYQPGHCWLYSENSKQKKSVKNPQCARVQTGSAFRGAYGVDVAQEAIGHFRRILWVFVYESMKSDDTFSALSTLRKGRGCSCDLQSLIKAHFTHQRLADPVDEGLWFLCSLRAAAARLQFHHFSLSVL